MRRAVDGQERYRCTGDGGFIGEDQLVHRRAARAAGSWPAQRNTRRGPFCASSPVDIADAVFTLDRSSSASRRSGVINAAKHERKPRRSPPAAV